MKKIYYAPEMEIIAFDTQDVITASPQSMELPIAEEE